MGDARHSELVELFEKAISQEKVEISADVVANLVLALKEQQLINQLLMSNIMKVALGELHALDIDEFSTRNDAFLEYEENLVRALAQSVKA